MYPTMQDYEIAVRHHNENLKAAEQQRLFSTQSDSDTTYRLFGAVIVLIALITVL